MVLADLGLELYDMHKLLLLKSTAYLFGSMNSLKAGEKLASLSLFCIYFLPKPFTLQSLCNHLGFQEGQKLITSS
jgi:hypothetical protein